MIAQIEIESKNCHESDSRGIQIACNSTIVLEGWKLFFQLFISVIQTKSNFLYFFNISTLTIEMKS